MLVRDLKNFAKWVSPAVLLMLMSGCAAVLQVDLVATALKPLSVYLAMSDGTVSHGGHQSAKATWTKSSDPTVTSYEIAIGTSAGGNDILAWTSVGDVDNYTATGLTLDSSKTYFTSVRAVDIGGRKSDVSQGDGWTVTYSALPMGVDPDSTVMTVAVDSLGRRLVGGYFTSVGGVSKHSIVRYKADETVDSTFNVGTGFNAAVRAIAIQSDGKIVVGGHFNNYNGATTYYLARLNSDGSRDASFLGGQFNYYVYGLAIQSDGKILVAGGFNYFNGVGGHNQFVRLNTDGSLDATFNVGSACNFQAAIAVTIQTDGKILLGGAFTDFNGGGQKRIVRLNSDGTTDGTFTSGTGFNGNVWGITVQPDSKIIVTGEFTTYRGVTKNKIVRLNSDGTIDATFNQGSGLTSGASNVAYQTLVGSGLKILVIGNFTDYNGASATNITRLNPDGTLDSTFVLETTFDSDVVSMARQPDGDIFVGGDFSTSATADSTVHGKVLVIH